MKKLCLAVLLALSMPMAAIAGTEPLVDPDPISVPANMSLDDVASAVLRGLAEHRWAPDGTRTHPGVIQASIRAHGGDQATIEVRFDTRKIQIKYVSSRRMDDQQVDGQRVISSRYIGWTRNLVLSITKALGSPSAGS